MKATIWIINPYGTLPDESWATYRSTMLAEALAKNGFIVTQFISNFEHRSKTLRCPGHKEIRVNDNYSIRIIPSTAYSSHISLKRIHYERTFAKNIVTTLKENDLPDVVILAEPALFYYDVLLKPIILKRRCKFVIDIIDIWPELFELAIPARWRRLSPVFLAPLFWWRKRLYQHADAIVAVAHDYIKVARTLIAANIPMEVVYWSYPASQLEVTEGADQKVNDLIAGKTRDEIWIIYAGTLGENYDIPAIIKVATVLKHKLPSSAKFKIIVAGDGPLKTLCEQTQNDTFAFLGRLAVDDLKKLYRSCDLALSTYKGESTVAMPIKAFDYLLFGLPMVNSLGKDLGELIRKYQVGLNYDPYSRSSLCEALYALIVDSELRRQYSNNAKKIARQFNSDIQYKKFVDVIKRLL